MSDDMPRNDDLLQEVTRLAARQVGVSPHRILAMTAARTMPGPVNRGWTRDLTHEAHEELADAINYINWEIDKQQQLAAPGLHVAQQLYLEAIGECVSAFEKLIAARELLNERCNKCGGSMKPAEGEFIPVLRCDSCGREVPR